MGDRNRSYFWPVEEEVETGGRPAYTTEELRAIEDQRAAIERARAASPALPPPRLCVAPEPKKPCDVPIPTPNLARLDVTEGNEDATRARERQLPDLSREDVTECAVDEQDEATRVQSPDPKVLAGLKPPIPREDPST